LLKNGAEVKVICTPSALDFVTPLTLSTLTKNPVHTHFFVKETGEWINHVELGKWADLMIIAPATANTLSKMADGRCDNLLIATYLSAACPLFFAPAMDLDMYTHTSTQTNISKLISYGHIELPATSGELASGLIGKGRMCEPDSIFKEVEDYVTLSRSLQDKKILVNAGPTHEKIDPVRFIGNYSSGKMGKSIANILSKRGAEVELVLGPVDMAGISPKVNVTQVTSAQEMYQACQHIYPSCQAGILAAAVADYTPVNYANQKIKKQKDVSEISLTLTQTKDILKSLGQCKKSGQVLIGFALETENEFENAQQKLYAKNLDFIVLNSMNDPGAGFQKDTNKVTIIERDGNQQTFDKKSKTEVAEDIVNLLQTYL